MYDAREHPCIARFIFDHSCVRANGTVRHSAFLEKRPPHNTSVNAHDALCKDIHWASGRRINPTRPLIGAADLESSAAQSTGLDVILDPTADDPFHAELRKWPNDKANRIEIARDLADTSIFVHAPASV